MKHILIVEDDLNIATLERDYLESQDYKTTIIDRGDQVIDALNKDHYDLILLDIMLPGMDGYEICRYIRNEIDIPILMVTAKSEGLDIIRGLGLGADDYITKPFDPMQLVARVRTHIQRYDRLTHKHESQDKIYIQDVVIETNTWHVYKNNIEVKLTNKEFELLRFMAENPNIVFSKETLLERIWGYDYVLDTATVTVHINRLREKIEDDIHDPKIIETVWGVGYRINTRGV